MESEPTWTEHLSDSSLPGGLLRCLKSLSELWNSREITIFVRNPSGQRVNRFSLDRHGDLSKKNNDLPDSATSSLLFGSLSADQYFSPDKPALYIRQRRADRPHAVLRISNSPILDHESIGTMESTRALLMAAASYAESFSHIEGASEPVIEQRLKSDFRDYLRPICEKIAKRSFLISSAFFTVKTSGVPELIHAHHYDFGKTGLLIGPTSFSLIEGYLERNGFQDDQPRPLHPREFGSLKDTADRLFSNCSSLCAVRIKKPYFNGLILFGVPLNYELTSSDQAIMKLIRDQLKNYVYIYHSFNAERYDLLRQQQEFGLEYAQEFTQVARHAARQTIGDVATNAQTLNLIAEKGQADEDGRLAAYQGLEDALEQVEMVYSEVKSLSDADVLPERINLRVLFEDMAAVFHSTFEELGINYTNDLRDDWVLGFDQQVKVAIFNLIQNSCEAFIGNDIPISRRRITVSLSGRKGHPVAFDDTAGGVRQLYDAQGNAVADRQLAWQRGVSGRGGSGFGMHIIKRYFEANDCTISFANYLQGTRFVIDVRSARRKAGFEN